MVHPNFPGCKRLHRRSKNEIVCSSLHEIFLLITLSCLSIGVAFAGPFLNYMKMSQV